MACQDNREGFGARIVFQNGVIAGGDSRGIFHRPPQFETNAHFALPAKREPVANQQRGFMFGTFCPRSKKAILKVYKGGCKRSPWSKFAQASVWVIIRPHSTLI